MNRNARWMKRRGTRFASLAFYLLLLPPIHASETAESVVDAEVRVSYTPGQPLNRFVPSHALGAAIDGHTEGEVARQLSTANVDAMLSAGLGPLTYRLRTELAGEAWHWNPRGTWSDATHRQGYWTSQSIPAGPIERSYGYRLPRRGNTLDEANNDGYSRIDDGDAKTYWKSNPYLDEHYTHESDAPAQWVVIDLGSAQPVDAIRIRWGEPFATDYHVEYGHNRNIDPADRELPVAWTPFPSGQVDHARHREELQRLAPAPISTRYIRVSLDRSSHTTLHASTDIRDRLGFAIREISVGTVNERGKLRDLIRHSGKGDRQTRIYVSSTDPWHRAIDRDPDTEQPGFDAVFTSRLSRALPVLTPVAVLYDTPENAAAQIRYLTARGYPIDRIELGEEPDGQFVTPEHYAALYREFYATLHDIDPHLQFGGPSLQDIEQSQVQGHLEYGKGHWLGGFIKYLQRHHAMSEFSFFSFEWYPFGDDCHPQQIVNTSRILEAALAELQQGGLTHDIPWIMSEYGYSAAGARAELDIDGALLNAESVGRFLTLGGDAAFLYGYEPDDVIAGQRCSSGNTMLFFRNAAGQITERTAPYWGARLLTQEWVQPGNSVHELFAASTGDEGSDTAQLTSAYAVHRPDGLWSLLLINKDPDRSYRVRIAFENGATHDVATFSGPVDLFQYSRAQYQLSADTQHPYPRQAQPPMHVTAEASQEIFVLPPYSITVIRGHTGQRASGDDAISRQSLK